MRFGLQRAENVVQEQLIFGHSIVSRSIRKIFCENLRNNLYLDLYWNSWRLAVHITKKLILDCELCKITIVPYGIEAFIVVRLSNNQLQHSTSQEDKGKTMGVKVLYIEDNPLNMRLVRKILRSIGMDMIEAMDGLTGVAMAARETPDLILMDVNLPDIDGLEATARLKADPTLSQIPVIALTANAMHGDRERCLAAGCDGYIAKPVSKKELESTITYFVSGIAPDDNLNEGFTGYAPV